MRYAAFAAVLALTAATASSCATGLKHTVALADVHRAGEEALASLAPIHHAAYLARVRAQGTLAAVAEVAAEIPVAGKAIELARADLRAAEAEVAAAKLDSDTNRLRAAEDRLARDRTAVQAAEARLAWSKLQKAAHEKASAQAEAEVVLRDAELEEARARLVAGQDASKASRIYLLSDFARQAEGARATYRKAAQVAEGAQRDADIARRSWEALAPGIAPAGAAPTTP
ncbi:hypothetical protein L6R50_12430 [Myxococcota bacterium]|nr:hypothetical protein [Myxococcota bacterium]